MTKEYKWKEKYICQECGMKFHYKQAYLEHINHHKLWYHNREDKT